MLRHFGDPSVTGDGTLPAADTELPEDRTGSPAPGRAGRPTVPCCDACVPQLLPDAGGSGAGGGRVAAGRRDSAGARSAARRLTGGARSLTGDEAAAVDRSIVEVVREARPAVGRTRVAEILRGSRSQKVLQSGYDGLPAYARHRDLRTGDLLLRIDELLESGELGTTGGSYPTLEVAGARASLGGD